MEGGRLLLHSFCRDEAGFLFFSSVTVFLLLTRVCVRTNGAQQMHKSTIHVLDAVSVSGGAIPQTNKPGARRT